MKKHDGPPIPAGDDAPAASLCVRDYMTRTVTALNDDARLLDAAGRAVGIISDRDVSRMAPSMLSRMTPEEYNQIFEATPITVAMTKNPITVSPDLPIRDAVTMLYEKKIGAIVVTENDKVVGILTVTDMLGLLNALLVEGQSGPATA